MKKFFTLIALTSALIPALHGMETSLPVTSPNLVNHIKNANAEAFTKEFIELVALNQLAIKPYITQTNLTELEQCAIGSRNALQQELFEAMSQGKNIVWKKLIGGSLICLPSGVVTIWGLLNAISKPEFRASKSSYFVNIPPMTIVYALASLLSSKAFIYGVQISSNGWNYQKELREQLKNLDIILTQIKQAKV